MSLKAVHIFFITVATLFCVGFGFLALRQDLTFLGVLGFVGAVALLVYGGWFLKKMKDVSLI